MLEGLKPAISVRPCMVRTVLGNLEQKDHKILADALQDENYWPAEALSKALNSRGIRLAGKSITKHRENQCTCKLLNA